MRIIGTNTTTIAIPAKNVKLNIFLEEFEPVSINPTLLNATTIGRYKNRINPELIIPLTKLKGKNTVGSIAFIISLGTFIYKGVMK